MGLIAKIKHWRRINKSQFFYYNFLCRNVIADKGCKIIPYKGTRISLSKTAQIHLHGSVYINDNKIKGSKAESLILLRDDSKWIVNGAVQLYYGTTIQVHNGAELVMGEAHMNTGTTIVCAYKMRFGQMVSTARGVFIFDSDHHPIYNSDDYRINDAKEVIIEDHVWIGLKSTILKGTHIKSGSVVSAHSLISGEIPGNALIATMPARPVMKDIRWER